MKLVMDKRDQSLEGALVAVGPFEEQCGDLRVGISNPAILGPFSNPSTSYLCLSLPKQRES
jgi:hypothetical protein